jgi:dolichol-phosphate mannosyltransferase
LTQATLPACELSLLILVQQEGIALQPLLTQLHKELDDLKIPYEVLLAVFHPDSATQETLAQFGRVIMLEEDAYGKALQTGLEQATGRYLLTMDADFSHPPSFVKDLWQARARAEILIASRYIRGGVANMPAGRLFFSRLLNLVFSRGLDLKVADMSSGFRLYRTEMIRSLKAQSSGLDILQEILVRALLEGFRILEIPFHFTPRRPSATGKRVFRFGLSYLKTFTRLWKLRNSVASADYDARAYHALMPPQRYWQRQRYRLVSQLLRGEGVCLDIGCGSSRIQENLPAGSVVLDILMRKLRYSQRYRHARVNGSALELPVSTAAFPCVLCSQVIEHIPRANVCGELDRVLQPGGLLILGTPDYAKWQWNVIEWLYKLLLPQAYADEHITHYTQAELLTEFVTRRGYTLEAIHYILQGELILALRKPTST